jgi:hypothetical protein
MHAVQVYDKKQNQGWDKDDNEKFCFYGEYFSHHKITGLPLNDKPFVLRTDSKMK